METRNSHSKKPSILNQKSSSALKKSVNLIDDGSRLQGSHKSINHLKPKQKTMSRSDPGLNQTSVHWFSNEYTEMSFERIDPCTKQTVKACIVKVEAIGKIASFADNSGTLWISIPIYPEPINIASILKRKVIKSFLSEKGVVIFSKRAKFLFNWDKIGVKEEIFKRKIAIETKFAHLFELRQYNEFMESCNLFHFASKSEGASSKQAYMVCRNIIRIYPSLQVLKIPEDQSVKGISTSKTHALCWTESGKLYSWGERSLALGHTDYSDDIETHPKHIVNFKAKIIQAVAGVHYSLALDSEGSLFQWGKKKLNIEGEYAEEFIFQPRKIQIPLDKSVGNNSTLSYDKVAVLKGNDNQFAVVGFSGNLYLWGEHIPQNIFRVHASTQQNSGSSQDHPLREKSPHVPQLCPVQKGKCIVDLAVRENCIYLVLTSTGSTIKSKEVETFKHHKFSGLNEILKQVRDRKERREKENKIAGKQPQLKKQFSSNRTKTVYRPKMHIEDGAETKDLFKTISNPHFSDCDDKLSRAIYEKKSKEQYFSKVKDQSGLFKTIMKGCSKTVQNRKDSSSPKLKVDSNKQLLKKISQARKKCKFRYSGGIEEMTQAEEFNEKQPSKLQRYKSSTKFEPAKLESVDHQRVEYLIKCSPAELQKARKKQLYEKIKESKAEEEEKRQLEEEDKMRFENMSNFHEQYNCKLNRILSKKESIEETFFKCTIQRIEKNSIEYRRKRNEEIALRKKRGEQKKLLQETLVGYLKKIYVVQALSNPLSYARETKIGIFAHNLKYNRVEKAIRRLYMSQRIKFDIQKLKKQHPKKFEKLQRCMSSFVTRWRSRKQRAEMRKITSFVVQTVCKKQIFKGIEAKRVEVKYLEKIGSWLKLLKAQKMKCLNLIWKRQAINHLSASQQMQNELSSMNLKKQMPTFKELMNQRIKLNPSLKIEHYLGVSPLFKCKLIKGTNYLALMAKEHKNDTLKENRTVLQQRKPKMVKLSSTVVEKITIENIDVKALLTNPTVWMLPYSRHSQLFINDKNIELSFTESVRFSENWIDHEKNCLEKVFETILQNNLRDYYKKMYKYRRETAMFIRDNWKKICERRWKYIVVYNQIKNNSLEVSKKERQLRKILRSIGFESILDSDILPERHNILQEVNQMKGAPVKPEKNMNLNQSEFKKYFRLYQQLLLSKSKELRRLKAL